MKVFLNEAEVKQALEQFVRTNFLNYDGFDIEVLDITDSCGDSFNTDGEAKAIIGVSKQVAVSPAPASCAPVMPVKQAAVF